MNADQVRAYVAATFPNSLGSPVAVAVQTFCAADSADRAVAFAQNQARATEVEKKRVLEDAMAHASSCIDACNALGVEWDEETLTFNIESNFPELNDDECEEISIKAIRAALNASKEQP